MHSTYTVCIHQLLKLPVAVEQQLQALGSYLSKNGSVSVEPAASLYCIRKNCADSIKTTFLKICEDGEFHVWHHLLFDNREQLFVDVLLLARQEGVDTRYALP